MMLGKTDKTARPSVGKAFIVKLFSQLRLAISTKKIINKEMIAKTIAKTPITER